MSPRTTTLAIFLLALAPRALAGRFLTVDEAYHWIERVDRFTQALAAGDWAGTNLIGHPGVTTLWLGAAGAALHRQALALGLLPPGDLGAQRALLRLPLAAVTALCVALAYPLLRRLVGGRAALLATLLMAGEPFLVAHSQLLHLDALLTSFMTLSLLAMLVAVQSAELKVQNDEPRRSPFISHGALCISGVFGGLALLTKSPAILLLPMAALISTAGTLRAASDGRVQGAPPVAFHFALSALRFALWGLVAAAVWLALWPAAWVDPLGAAARVALQASADGGAPHGWGNFFLGRALADPGPLFYPVTLAFRLAPWTLVGLVAGAGFLVRDMVGLLRRRPISFTDSDIALATLLVFALGFTVALSLPPKKFDRYVLPIYPALDVLAAAGLLRLGEALHVRLTKGQGPQPGVIRPRSLVFGVWSLVVALLALNLAWHHPYPLAYFNPLLGGGPTAARAVPVGWGEGYELAGDFIAAQYNGADRPAAARYEPVLGPFVPAGAAPLAWWQIPGRVDYAVVYIDQVQRDDKPETFRPLLEEHTPIYTVRINGIEYAWVYQIAPPVATPLPADFGDALHLRGYGLDASAVRASGALTLTLEWEARAAPQADYALFAHVFDAAGNRVGQVDVPPGDVRAPTSTWQPGRPYSLVQRIPLDPGLPAGTYRVAVGVYDPASFARLPLRVEARPPLPEAGADALVLGGFELP